MLTEALNSFMLSVLVIIQQNKIQYITQ